MRIHRISYQRCLIGLIRKLKKILFYLAVHKMFDQNDLCADFDYNYADVFIYILFGSLRL
ncbi:hypothetical protein LEP1GSC195_3938 [Leptospira wolbachii serovar Codice str. CDC]|uniref:Uncharacterized protein n=1 Tax=Leptospira wolbachii serovar Codice str. CDC TaxID=1218599 RepID=R8ZZ10_9LEPT|nr:hypothetical protein LEP1GSC195_3938 [Leptospira wolbachii serovar Codice str. CDC]